MTDFLRIHIKLSKNQLEAKKIDANHELFLIYYFSVADAFQSDSRFHLLQFVLGMHSVWDSVALLFLLLTQSFGRKTSHSSGLCSFKGFKWR